MAADRFIRFDGPKARRPKKDELLLVLKNFVGGAGGVEWVDDQDRAYITLPGHPSFPFRGLPEMEGRDRHDGEQDRPRWIEVWQDPRDGTVDVMTRGMDEFTNVVAEGVAKMIARWWGGEYEDEDE